MNRELHGIFTDIAEHVAEPRAEIIDKEARFPDEAFAELGRHHLMGLPYPHEVGGGGASYQDYVQGVEILSRACAATGCCYTTHVGLACYPLWRFGSDSQQQMFLRPMFEGRYLGSFALTERQAGTDVGGILTTAERVGGGYLLNGSKIYITNAGRAYVYIVFARTGKGRTQDISAFVVTRDDEGLVVSPPQQKMGIRGAWTSKVQFENLYVPESRRISDEGDGFFIAMESLNIGRLGIAAQATGIAQRALKESCSHLRQRRQFGRSLSEFQGLRWKIADMYARIEASHRLVLHAALLLDRGEGVKSAASAAKLLASETAVQCASEAVQIAGGEGYLIGSTVERLYRDAKITQIYEGTSEVQKMILAESLLSEDPSSLFSE